MAALDPGLQPNSTLPMLRSYLLTASPLWQPQLAAAMRREGIAALHSLSRLLFHLTLLLSYHTIVALKLLTISIPYLLLILDSVVQFHRTQLTTQDLLLEFVFASLLILFFTYRSHLTRQYKLMEKFISTKSKAAAQILPHLSFFSMAFLGAIIGQKFLHPLTSFKILPIFTLIIPVLSTLNVVLYHRKEPALMNQLRIWMILGCYHSMATFAAQLPFSTYLSHYLPYLREMVFIILLWVQISSVFTHVVFDLSSSYLRIMLRNVPSVDMGIASALDTIVLFLRSRGFSTYYLNMIRGLLADIPAFLISLLFCCTPTYISQVGINVVGIIIPLSKTIELNASITTKKRQSKASDDQIEFLVHYWLSFGALWTCRLYFFTLWPSFTLLSFLLLQNSSLLGASWVIREWFNIFHVIIQRNGRDFSPIKSFYQTPESTPSMSHTSDGTTTRETPESTGFNSQINPKVLQEELNEIAEAKISNDSTSTSNSASSIRRRKKSSTRIESIQSSGQ